MFEVFTTTLVAILPVFITIFIGAGLSKLGFFPEEVRSGIVKLVFYVGTPALIIRQVGAADLRASVEPLFILFVVGIILLEVVLMWALCFFVKDPKKKGAVIQIGFRSNFAIVGMPLAERLLSTEGVARTAIALSFTILVYNVMAVVVLSYYGGEERKLKPVLLGIIKNPLIIGVLIGLLISLTPIPMVSGQVHFEILKTLGYLASSAGLLVIGSSISLKGFLADRGLILYSVLLRCLIAPAFVLGCAILFGFRGDALPTLAIMSATPAAVNCYVMAKKMGVDPEITAFGISFTTIVSLFSIFLSIFLLRTTGLAG